MTVLPALVLFASAGVSTMPLWPEKAMPDSQAHQIAARLEIAQGAAFDAASHRMPFLTGACCRPAIRQVSA